MDGRDVTDGVTCDQEAIKAREVDYTGSFWRMKEALVGMPEVWQETQRLCNAVRRMGRRRREPVNI